MKLFNYTVVIEKDEDGSYLAICPALQGCYSEGASKEEALEMIKDAIKLHIEDRSANNELEEKGVRYQVSAIHGSWFMVHGL